MYLLFKQLLPLQNSLKTKVKVLESHSYFLIVKFKLNHLKIILMIK